MSIVNVSIRTSRIFLMICIIQPSKKNKRPSPSSSPGSIILTKELLVLTPISLLALSNSVAETCFL